MKILVIPDIHLKPWIYDAADAVLLKRSDIDGTVTLGDIPDDFGCKNNKDTYNRTFDRAEEFLKDHPETYWCIGNHECSYLWDEWTNALAYRAKKTAEERVKQLYAKIPKEKLAFAFRIGDVVFSHAGITKVFADTYLPGITDMDEAIRQINKFGKEEMWNINSPIWARPVYVLPRYATHTKAEMYLESDYLQVTGHTPMKEVMHYGNLVICDVFSTDRKKQKYGSEEFVIVDTDTREIETIQTDHLGS